MRYLVHGIRCAAWDSEHPADGYFAGGDFVRRTSLIVAGAGTIVLALAGGITAWAGQDAGVDREQQTQAHAVQDFGVVQGLPASSTTDIDAATASSNPLALATFAKGLKARVVTSGVAAPNLDMAALWPADHPQYILSCNEEGTGQPGVQRINLATGAAQTIVTGTTSCDPLHVTPWGTVVFGEETTTGHLYEMIDPVSITNATLDRVTGVASTDKIVRRDALGSIAFEGVGFLPSGVTYFGDELAPSAGTPGGAYYKFVPSMPRSGGTVTSLSQSPLASGSVFALKVGQGSNTGQGMASGDGTWVPVAADATTGSLRPAARTAGATGYYRPEDLSLDQAKLASGSIRFCGNNTGREQAHYYGETICVSDGALAAASTNAAVPQVQVLVAGSSEFNMPDNIAYQPGRGNWIIHEDAETTFERPHNNDLWSCLDDGADSDLQSDGCLRIASLNDLSAEWTGGFFDATGEHFYVSVQHNKSGHGVLLDVTGWR
jgi:secreted PhoX family phosphatase